MFGVYVHIPFCSRRCDYCAFATWTDRAHLMAEYAAACRAEICNAVAGGMAPATSVFFGGGTPSLLPAELLTSILEAIPLLSAVETAVEVTVECNPDTVTTDLMDGYRAAGVTRLSFGVQSMVGHVLASLGRTHKPEAVNQAVAMARSTGFDDFNLDLIFGAANESEHDWRSTLDQALALDPNHVSAYALTVEPGTALSADLARHPDDDRQAARYLVADRVLGEAGLDNYEISNWARPGRECRHNLLYWTQGDYRGIGCAAHSHVTGRRWWNVRTPERYIARVASGLAPEAGGEHLDRDGRFAEAQQLALRTRHGVMRNALDGAEVGALDELRELQLIEERGERIVLTTTGRLLANEVAVRLGLVSGAAGEPEGSRLASGR